MWEFEQSNCQPGLLIKSWRLEKKNVNSLSEKLCVLWRAAMHNAVLIVNTVSVILYHKDPMLRQKVLITLSTAIRYLFLVLSSRIDGKCKYCLQWQNYHNNSSSEIWMPTYCKLWLLRSRPSLDPNYFILLFTDTLGR